MAGRYSNHFTQWQRVDWKFAAVIQIPAFRGTFKPSTHLKGNAQVIKEVTNYSDPWLD